MYESMYIDVKSDRHRAGFAGTDRSELERSLRPGDQRRPGRNRGGFVGSGCVRRIGECHKPGNRNASHHRDQRDWWISSGKSAGGHLPNHGHGVGFSSIVQQVDVVLNKTGTLNATLTPGATSETIEVSGVAATIDTSSAQIQTNYDARFSQDLGITSAGGTGAGVLNLSLLSPGVTQSSSLGLGAGPSVGGQRPYNNNFTVEGVDNNNKAVTGNLITFPNDAVENFSLLANQFDTEFG